MNDEVDAPDPAAQLEGKPLAEAATLNLPDVWPSDPGLLAGRISEARTLERRQRLWWVLGTTPAAILPIWVALWYDRPGLATAFSAVAVVIQTIRWFGASRSRKKLEKELDLLDELATVAGGDVGAQDMSDQAAPEGTDGEGGAGAA